MIVKAHRSAEAELVLDERVRLQTHVAEAKRFAPRPPRGSACVCERLCDRRGASTRAASAADARGSRCAGAIASSLNVGVRLLEPLAADRGCRRTCSACARAMRALAAPAQPAVRLRCYACRGAEEIDASRRWGASGCARRTARGRARRLAVEHLRFDAGRVVLAYDWQSVCRTEEAALVGFAAHAFCADWSGDDPRQAPSLEEAQRVRRGLRARARCAVRPRGAEPCGAVFAYSVAYTTAAVMRAVSTAAARRAPSIICCHAWRRALETLTDHSKRLDPRRWAPSARSKVKRLAGRAYADLGCAGFENNEG